MNINNTNNTNNTINALNDLAPNEETISRAILTFCLEGADAIMYTLLLGSQSAKEIVAVLRTMVKNYTEQQLTDSAQQMQLPIISEVAAQENDTNSKTFNSRKRNKNQELVSTMVSFIKKHKDLSILENYFNKGLTAWGYHNDNVSKSLGVLHNSISKWCVRLLHLPTWNNESLCQWFTSGGKQWIIAPNSKYWPKQLQDIALHSHFAPPLCLWGMGDPQALTQCHNPLAIVGSRSCTDYGRELAYQFAYDCAAKGHTVVSGGAYGIDAAAHWGALAAFQCAATNKPIGKTIAVFAGGLNHMGPQSNTQLFQQIIANNGACISELCPDTTPVGHRFLLRNRIIAALSSKILVAQARLQSGALNTASWATDLNRELYAIPGDITHPHHAGCNKLIHDSQAIMVCSQQDINILFPQSHHYVACTSSQYQTNNTSSNNMNQLQKNSTTHTQQQIVSTFIMPSDCDALQQQILEAISTCKRKRKPTNIDNIYTIITSSYATKEPKIIPSIAEVSGSIALLELGGTIAYQGENIVLAQQKVI